MDIPDIERVVQFMLPSSLLILIQRFGRFGRSGQPALAILLVEATAFHTKKNMPRNEQLMIKAELDEDGMPMEGNEDEETLQYRKKVEDGVRQWIDALACRRAITNEYFANPPAIANTGAVSFPHHL
jgi:superfamily II DNA helicase RecQ